MISPVRINIFNEKSQISLTTIILLNAILSSWIIFTTPTINNDGILYLLTGKNFLESGLSGAFSTYTWPFYSIAFATLSKITPLSLLHSAYLVTTLGFVVMSYAFTRVVAEMGGNRKVQLIALFIILCQPLYANYRAALIRDPLFLGFLLLSLLELIRYSKTPLWQTPIKWMIYVLLACLARPEAFLVGLISPLALLVSGERYFKNRLEFTIKFLFLPILICTTAVLLSTLIFPDILYGTKFTSPIRFYNQSIVTMHKNMQILSEVIAEKILIHSAKDDAIFATYAMLFSICIINILSALTPFYTALIGHSCISKTSLEIYKPSKPIILLSISAIFFYLLLFTLAYRFSLERYSFHLVALLMLFLPFIINNVLEQINYRKLSHTLIYTFALGYFLDTTINTNYKKAYISEAAHWISINTDKRTLITNISYLAFFGQPNEKQNIGIRDSNETILDGAWEPNYAYAIKVNRNEILNVKKIIEDKEGEIIHTTSNKDGKHIVIFQKQKTEQPQTYK